MKWLALVSCLVAAAPAGAAELMVVGRGGETLLQPRKASVKGARVVGCRVAGRTALAALARTPLALRVEDFGSCGGSLYVAAIEGQRERGADGWVYKVGDRAASVGAGDPAGRFGKSARVLWFWCESGSGGCQRTLRVTATRTGDRVTARVRAYDDHGASVPAAGAHVTAGSVSAVADSHGVALLPSTAKRVVATKNGLVRSFPARVRG